MKLLHSSYSAYFWRKIVRNAVDTYYVSKISGEAERYRSVKYLSIRSFISWKAHLLLSMVKGSTRQTNRVHARLMVAAGTCILQSNWAVSQNDVNVCCMLKTTRRYLTSYQSVYLWRRLGARSYRNFSVEEVQRLARTETVNPHCRLYRPDLLWRCPYCKARTYTVTAVSCWQICVCSICTPL